MTSPCNRNSPTPRRHELIFVSKAAWRALLETRDDLAAEPLVTGWIDRGWPLVARRATPCEKSGVALGLPLPPFAGKRRLPVLVQPDDIVSTTPPPPLREAIGSAPPDWRHALEAVANLASRHGVEARIFGSLAWQRLTRLQYLTDSSDLDVLLPMPPHGNAAVLTAGLAAIEATAPMRLDGELVRGDGAAVNWRELHDGAREILVKTTDGVALLDTSVFLGSEIRP
jgi:phosphoribosyl-dephospho-CoA transferase